MKKINKFITPQRIFLFLLLLFAAHLLLRVYQYLPNYLEKFDGEYWEYRYNISQWVVPNSKNGIGDDGLYTYAGWKYIQGLNPVLNSPEVPPLGKYILGATIVLFNNHNIFALLTGVSSLTLLFLFNKILFKKNLYAFLPVLLFSFEPLFWTQLKAPYFDLLQLTFLMAAMISLLKRKYFLSSLMIGFFAATRFSFMSVLPVFTFFVFVVLAQRKDVMKFLLSLIMWPFGFILTYAQYFLLGNSFFDFLGVMKYVFNFYYTGAKSNSAFMVLGMIFSGKWYTWWGSVLPISEWSVAWPLSFVVSIFAFLQGKLYKKPILLVAIWVAVYFLFLLIIPVYPRYLLLFMPFLYNLIVWVLFESTIMKSWLRQGS